jgi:hypothetical protein
MRGIFAGICKVVILRAPLLLTLSFSCFGPVTTSHCRHTMENTNHHSLVVANATAIHGNRNAVLLTLMPLAPLHNP